MDICVEGRVAKLTANGVRVSAIIFIFDSSSEQQRKPCDRDIQF